MLVILLIAGCATDVMGAKRRTSKNRATAVQTKFDNPAVLNGAYSNSTCEAVINLLEPSVLSPFSETKTYGYIEVEGPRGVHGYEIIGVSMTESGGCDIFVLNDIAASSLSENEKFANAELVSLAYNPTTRTLSFKPSAKGDSFFKTLKLKRKK